MKETESVLDQMIHQIRNGMLLRKPIVYLHTSELELVRRILNSDQVVVRMTRYPMERNQNQNRFVPFSKVYPNHSSGCHGILIDDNVINIKACSLKELSARIRTLGIRSGEDNDHYGRFTFPNSKTSYPLPSLLAVHVQKNILPYSDLSAFDALFPFLDRYQQETEENSAIRSSLVLLYGEPIELPSWLTNECYIVEEPYPDRKEITSILQKKMFTSGLDFVPEEVFASYVAGFLGTPLIQVEHTVDYLLSLPPDPFTKRPQIENQANVRHVLATLKEQKVKQVRLLELQKSDPNVRLGGMKRFYDWLEHNKESILQTDWMTRRTGAVGHKGILMCGIPGCGKSAAVNLLAKELELPVLKMDIGRLMGGIVGESEHNMHQALRLAEAMAPCILYIDEIEKGFNGSGRSREDTNGVTKRMFGILLSWMQDCTKPVYLFATANHLSGIPKEFFRSGRFDSHFALYLPTYEECIEIFQKRMEQAEHTVLEYHKTEELFRKPCFEPETLGLVLHHLLYEKKGEKKGRFLTGADITKLVNMALREFAQRKSAICHTEWITALKRAVDTTTVYGDGDENLNSIAICYLRMMRLGFQPTCEDALFQPSDYSVRYEQEKITPVLSERKTFRTEYDQVLYQTIREKMLFFAARLEENAITELM